MIKAIIFDVDGVLLDNRKEVIEAFKKTGKELGRVPSVSEIKKTFGLPWEDMLVKMYGRIDANMKKIYLKAWDKYEHEMKIMKYSEYVLKKLKIRKAIATSKSKKTLKRQIGKLLKYFEVVVSKEETKKHKPNPEPLLLACKKLKIKPREAVYIGDAVIDYQAAKNAGINFIGFISGSATKEEFRKLNVKFFVSLKGLLREFK